MLLIEARASTMNRANEEQRMTIRKTLAVALTALTLGASALASTEASAGGFGHRGGVPPFGGLPHRPLASPPLAPSLLPRLCGLCGRLWQLLAMGPCAGLRPGAEELLPGLRAGRLLCPRVCLE